MKVADVKLSWKRSPDIDIKSVQVVVVNDGTESTADFGPEVEALNIVVAAQKSVSFKVVVKDSEGLVSSSESYSFTIGDLTAPNPATDLRHEVLAIQEV